MKSTNSVQTFIKTRAVVAVLTFSVILTGAVAQEIGAPSVNYKPEGKIVSEFSFEESLWLIRRSREQAQHGSYALKMTADGTSDDGTVWVMRSFPVNPHTDYRVHLGFYLGLLRESPINPWPVVAYVGTTRPRQEKDFTIIGHTGQGDGWVPFSYAHEINTGDSKELWVACGFTITWETWRTFYMDSVKVTLWSGQTARNGWRAARI